MENLRTKQLKKVGYPNYRISDCGKVINKHGKILETDISNGYKRVWLYNFGVRERFFIHVLVAMHFCRNQNEEYVVNHKDHNKMNNHYSNLEWVTQSENIKKYFIHKRKNLKKRSNRIW